MKKVRVKDKGYGTFDLPPGDHQTKSFKAVGVYEKGFVDMLLRFLGPEDVVIDVGACLGAHSIPYGLRCLHVHAFEPNVNALEFLRRNVTLNALEERVTVHPVGLGNRTGSYRLKESLATSGNIGGTQFDLNFLATAEGRKIARIDDLNLPKAKLMKIDVEGMELEVLKGAKYYLLAHKPILFIECAADRNPILEFILFSLEYVTLRRHSKYIFAYPDTILSRTEIAKMAEERVAQAK